jgi:hypothetical protein
MGRLVEIFGAIGGSVGLVYAAGYLVLAGHYRVLGVAVPSVDPTVLISSAWEFLFQGTLLALQRAIQSQLGLPALIALMVGVPIGMFSRPWVKRALSRWLPSRVLRLFRTRGSSIALATAIVLVLSLEIYTVVRFVVPAGAVASLLSGERAASPFAQIKEPWRNLLERDWMQLRRALIGDGDVSDVAILRRLYSVYLFSVLLSLAASIWLWRMRRGNMPRREAVPLMACLGLAIILAAHAPLYYGVALKSYRYPRVQLWPASDEHQDGLVAQELKENFRISHQFLLGASSDDYYLYDDFSGKISIIKRDLVGIVKFNGEQFVLRKLNGGK